MNNTLELRNNKKLSIFLVIGSSALLIYLLYDAKLFRKETTQIGGWILLLPFAILCLFSWTLFFDKSVQVTINEIGIFWTKRILFIRLNKKILWPDVESCYLTDNTSKGVQDLNFNFTSKRISKTYKLSLNSYDKSCVEINDIIEFYSKKFKFGFLGINDEI